MTLERIYDLYGSKTLSITEVRDVVARATGLDLRPRESYQMGGTYYRGGDVGGPGVVIQHNADEDGEPVEDGFAEYGVLVRLNDFDRADEVRALLERVDGLEFLLRTSR